MMRAHGGTRDNANFVMPKLGFSAGGGLLRLPATAAKTD
jgi:hypothetical protein